jgi:lauroyl/myristoyl acyltransferase
MRSQRALTGAGTSLPSQLVDRLIRMADTQPRAGFRLAGLAGVVLGARLGGAWTPSATELRGLLGSLDERTVARLQRRIASREVRNRALLFVLRRSGSERILPLVQIRGADSFLRHQAENRPTIVVFWHMGAARSVETAVAKLGCSVLCASIQSPPGPDPGFRRLPVSNAASGTRFLMEALRELKRGGVPVLAVDGPGGKSRRTPFLGRSLPVPTGVSALARMAGARIVPATSRWVGASSAIEVNLHDPLPDPVADLATPEEWEHELAVSAMRWFEHHLRTHPEDLRPLNIRRCLHPASAP